MFIPDLSRSFRILILFVAICVHVNRLSSISLFPCDFLRCPHFRPFFFQSSSDSNISSYVAVRFRPSALVISEFPCGSQMIMSRCLSVCVLPALLLPVFLSALTFLSALLMLL